MACKCSCCGPSKPAKSKAAKKKPVKAKKR
jgi:hypothetical protein